VNILSYHDVNLKCALILFNNTTTLTTTTTGKILNTTQMIMASHEQF